MLDAVIEFEDMHAGFAAERVLPQIQCPVLILQADPIVGAALEDADVAWAQRLLKDGRSLKLAGRGHGMHYEDPGAVGAAISRWVGSLDS